MQLNSDGTLTISCKVPGRCLPLLRAICDLKGCSMNDLLKMCLHFLIETAKITTEPSEDMKVLMHMMRIEANWQSMFNYVNNSQLDIAQVILVLQQSDGSGDKSKPREGFSLAMFDKPFCGDTAQTLCTDSIVERVLEIAMGKDDYWDLRSVARHFDAESIREALIRMVHAQTILNLDEEERGELPGMGNQTEGGRVYAYGQRTKIKKHRTPDGEAAAQQMRIQFNDEDREVADYEVKDWEGSVRQTDPEPPEAALENELGFRPHGGEW